MTCHNCGLPDDGSGRGLDITITIKPENSFQRTKKCKVWCHCPECAVQSRAVAKYGPASHRWPITLAQFRAMN